MAEANNTPARPVFLMLSLVLSLTLQSTSRGAQHSPTLNPENEARFRAVLPGAERFVCSDETLPHYRAYGPGPANDSRQLIGLIVLTHEVEPYEVGYAGRIDILVGMTTAGVITGVEVMEHDEPYGDFSIDEPALATIDWIGNWVGSRGRVCVRAGVAGS